MPLISKLLEIGSFFTETTVDNLRSCVIRRVGRQFALLVIILQRDLSVNIFVCHMKAKCERYSNSSLALEAGHQTFMDSVTAEGQIVIGKQLVNWCYVSLYKPATSIWVILLCGE